MAENESDLFVSHQTGTSLLLISDVKDVFERFPQSVHHIYHYMQKADELFVHCAREDIFFSINCSLHAISIQGSTHYIWWCIKFKVYSKTLNICKPFIFAKFREVSSWKFKRCKIKSTAWLRKSHDSWKQKVANIVQYCSNIFAKYMQNIVV